MAYSTTIEEIEHRFSQISHAMRLYPHWLLTSDKKPVYPRNWNDPDELLTFQEALARLARQRGNADGIAYAFQKDGPFGGATVAFGCPTPPELLFG